MGGGRHAGVVVHRRRQLRRRVVRGTRGGGPLAGEEHEGQRLGPAQSEPLGPGDARPLQGRQLSCRLHALGDDDGADLPGEDHQGCGQGLAGRVLVDVLGDRLVQLDDVGAQAQHVAEGRVPGPGVVDRQLHPFTAQGVEGAAGPAVVGDAGVLGEFQDEAVDGNARSAHHAQQATVEQRRG